MKSILSLQEAQILKCIQKWKISSYSNLIRSDVISVSQLAGIYHKGLINYAQHQK